jgi:hypothetical protein
MRANAPAPFRSAQLPLRGPRPFIGPHKWGPPPFCLSGLNREPRTKPNSWSPPRGVYGRVVAWLPHEHDEDPARPFRNGRPRSRQAASPDRTIPSPSTAPVGPLRRQRAAPRLPVPVPSVPPPAPSLRRMTAAAVAALRSPPTPAAAPSSRARLAGAAAPRCSCFPRCVTQQSACSSSNSIYIK